MTDQPAISRRHFLRTTILAGSGLAMAAFVGCSDDGDGGATPTHSAAPTAPAVPTTNPAPTLASPRWGRLPEAGLIPAPRHDHSLVTDGQRLYLFGGRDSSPLGDFWVYNLTTAQWSQVAAAGPPARFGHNAGYDPASSRMLVFGGQAGGFFNDVWAYAPTSGTWREIPFHDSPAPRYGAASALDSDGRLVVSHGFTDTGRFDDTWVMGVPAGDAWVDLSPPAGERPIKRCLTRGAWDPVSGRFLLFGGQTDSAPFLGDTWQFTAGIWLQITGEQAPSPRNLFSMVRDEEQLRALLFGGRAEDGPANDVWVFDGTTDTWSRLATQGEPPSPRNGHDAVWLPESRSMLVFGGEDADGDQNDLWELSFGS